MKETLKEMINRIIKEETSSDGMTLEQAKAKARKESKENGGAVQHVDEHGSGSNKYYTVSDWMSDDTVWSVEGNREW